MLCPGDSTSQSSSRAEQWQAQPARVGRGTAFAPGVQQRGEHGSTHMPLGWRVCAMQQRSNAQSNNRPLWQLLASGVAIHMTVVVQYHAGHAGHQSGAPRTVAPLETAVHTLSTRGGIFADVQTSLLSWLAHNAPIPTGPHSTACNSQFLFIKYVHLDVGSYNKLQTAILRMPADQGCALKRTLLINLPLLRADCCATAAHAGLHACCWSHPPRHKAGEHLHGRPGKPQTGRL